MYQFQLVRLVDAFWSVIEKINELLKVLVFETDFRHILWQVVRIPLV